jgi:predicted esterase
MTDTTQDDPHKGQPVLRHGPPVDRARIALILLHGRGASAEDILGLTREFQWEDVACLAPQAAGRTWYPYSFLAPIPQNEPHLSDALGVVGRLVADLQGQGLTTDRIALLGFSQGACLALEFAARNAATYAAVVGLSGGLIGPAGTSRNYPGALSGTPVFLGCSDIDAHIPIARVRESAEVFRRMGAPVDERIYPGMGHTINQDELEAVDALLGPRPQR